jgi:cytochrome c oxidase subunit 2
VNELFHDLLDLPPQASSMARSIDTLHYVVIGTAFLVALASFAWIAVAMVRFRDRGTSAAQPARRRIRITPRRELALAGGTLAVFVAFWVVGFAQYRALRSPPDGAMRIYVVAKQWMWAAVYPDGTSVEDDIRVPVGEPVHLLMTSRDVIHSFYVAAFRVKQDVLPGRTTELWFTATIPGTYDILCAEYCGAGHSRMRGHVIAMSRDDFARWLAGHSAPSLAATGERVAAERGCLRCHTVDGTPHLGPTWRGLYGSTVPLSTGDSVVADETYLTESMMDPSAKLRAGFPSLMPSYQGLLTAPEAASIVEYIRSLR